MKNNALKNAAQKLIGSESEVLHSPKEYDFSDSSIDESFDILAEMAQKVTQCSVAAISFTNSEQLFFKSKVGLQGGFLCSNKLPFEIVLSKSDFYEVQDLSKHPTIRFKLFTKGGAPFEYYAGVPIINKQGFSVGTICVFDIKPQKMTPDKIQLLKLLAKKVLASLELFLKERSSKEALEAKSQQLIKGHMDLLLQGKKLEKARAGVSSKEQLLRGILDNSPHLISLLDSRGYYVMVNNAVANFLKLPVESIVGKHASEMYSDKQRQVKNLESMQLVLSSGKTSPAFEEELIIDGATNHYHVSMIPVEDSTGQLMVLRIATNVTELKSLEVNLNRKNAELESLIYSLSHDLRGPISSILGLLNVEKYSSLSDMRQYFKMIKEQTLRMDTSIHDLVELKNVTNKVITPEAVNIIEIITQAASDFSNQTTEIEFNYTENLVIKSDQYFIQVAVNRILANAVTYHRKDSRNPKVDITAQKDESGISVILKDNGIGISARALPRVFEMFYRGSGSSTGHGLGLYIAQKGLMRVKGTIDLNSIEGVGTEVKIFIPWIEGAAYFE